MDGTRIFSLNKDGSLAHCLYLLGGLGALDSLPMAYFTPSVWRLDWFGSNQSYHWTENDEVDPPMGELHH